MKQTRRILVLNVHKKDASTMNDFADQNARLLIDGFGGGRVFHFSDSAAETGIRPTEREIMRLVRDEGVDTVFFAPNGDSYELSIEFFRDLRERTGARLVLWALDDEMIFDVLSKYYAQVFDAAVTTDYYACFAYRKLGVPSMYYFSSYLKKDFHPMDIKKDIDVSFVGDCVKGGRADCIEYLRKNGISVETFGDGSENGFVKKEDIPSIFSRSKINLNFTKVDSAGPLAWFLNENSLTNIVRQNKGRPMEIALTRSFCLSEHSPSLGETFVPGKEIDVFYDERSLLEKVRHYLADDSLRARIAEAAFNKAKRFEAEVYFPGLIEGLLKLLDGSSHSQRDHVIHRDTVFKKNHVIRLTILMLFQLSKLKLAPAFGSFARMFQYGPVVFLSAFSRGLSIGCRKALNKRRRKDAKDEAQSPLHSLDNAPLPGRGRRGLRHNT